MSDYRPLDTEKNITDMPEECIRLIFLPLPLNDLMNAGRVCKLWNLLQKSVCLTKKSLILLIGPRSDVPKQLKRNFANNGTKIAQLRVAKIASLQKTFPNVTEIIVSCYHATPSYVNQIIRLLARFSHQLVVLKLRMLYYGGYEKHQRALYDVINVLPKLKNLDLQLKGAYHYELPILAQLEQFHFHVIGARSPSIVHLWAPYLEERLEPLQIGYRYTTSHFSIESRQTELADIPPKTAAMFYNYYFPNLQFTELNQLKAFTDNFTNLRSLSFTVSDIPVTQLLTALASLKQLRFLTLRTNYSANFNHDTHQMLVLPQLPFVIRFTLNHNHNLTSHADITRWKLRWTMPKLRQFYVNQNSYNTKCTDCKYKPGNIQQMKKCLLKQMRTLKKQCKRLRAVEFKSSGASCSLNEIRV